MRSSLNSIKDCMMADEYQTVSESLLSTYNNVSLMYHRFSNSLSLVRSLSYTSCFFSMGHSVYFDENGCFHRANIGITSSRSSLIVPYVLYTTNLREISKIS